MRENIEYIVCVVFNLIFVKKKMIPKLLHVLFCFPQYPDFLGNRFTSEQHKLNNFQYDKSQYTIITTNYGYSVKSAPL